MEASKIYSAVDIEAGESNENLCAIVFGSNTVVLYLVSLIWKRERGSILTLVACVLMAVSVSLLFWEEPFKFEVRFNFKVSLKNLSLLMNIWKYNYAIFWIVFSWLTRGSGSILKSRVWPTIHGLLIVFSTGDLFDTYGNGAYSLRHILLRAQKSYVAQ